MDTNQTSKLVPVKFRSSLYEAIKKEAQERGSMLSKVAEDWIRKGIEVDRGLKRIEQRKMKNSK